MTQDPPAPSTRELYLGDPPDAAFAVLHPSRDPSPVAVVICPPLGWEDMTSYRPRRAWAEHLAARGVPCLRVSYPGTGDSAGGPRDPGRVAAWSAAVDQSARYLRSETGARVVIALGLGVGGLIACHAAQRGSLDGLIAWAMPGRGSELVRQLRAFGRLERSTFWGAAEPRSALAEGEMEAGGYVLSGQTIADLRSLELAQLELDGALGAGVLVLEQDGIAVDEGILGALRDARIEVSTAAGPGWAEMTAHPQTAELSTPVLEAVDEWLRARGQGAGPHGPRLDAIGSVRDTLVLQELGVTEVPIAMEIKGVRLRGIQLVPEQAQTDLAVLFLNAGAQRRIGPNRIWVEASRRWAARGVPSVRIDIQGIGESDGGLAPYRDNRHLNSEERVEEVIAVVHELRARGVANDFLLVGLCGGAYWSFHALLREPAVRAAVAINPFALIWAAEFAPARDLRRVFVDRSWALIRKNATPARVKALLRWLVSAPVRQTRSLLGLGAGSVTPPTEAELLDRALGSGKQLTFVFAERERLLEEFTRLGRIADFERSANVSLHALDVNDHTLRPTWAQREVHRILDEALDRQLAIVDDRQPPRPAQAAGF